MIRRATVLRCTILSAILTVTGVASASTGTRANHLAPKTKSAVRHAHLAVATTHLTTAHAVAKTPLRPFTRSGAGRNDSPDLGGANGRLVRVAVKHRSTERVLCELALADDVTAGDVTEWRRSGRSGRQRSQLSWGNMNGTALAIDPATGRILAMVNQKLALSSGAEPCSTIKLTVALAALQEGIITRETPVALGGGYHLNLTEALAHSNNLYFETLGRSLGFERVKHYANQLGLGEPRWI